MPVVRIAFFAAACCSACNAAPQPATPTVPDVARGATAVIDEARCTAGTERLHPFVVSWDAAEHAELAVRAATSLIVTRKDGCDLHVLPACNVPGEYRWHPTAGGRQRIDLVSEDDLYAKVPLGVATLSGALARGGRITVEYDVRGLSCATRAALHRSELGPGCEGATHFVLNFAAGAYVVSTSEETRAGAEAAALGAGAGGAARRSTTALLRGGDLAACEVSGDGCRAPVRLRLSPIFDGEPPAGAPPAVYAATDTGTVASTRSELAVQAAIAVAVPSVRACHADALGAGSTARGRLSARFDVAPDGTIVDLEVVPVGEVDPLLVTCARDVLRAVRLPPAAAPATLVHPVELSP